LPRALRFPASLYLIALDIDMLASASAGFQENDIT